MRYERVAEARFLERPNRFVAYVELLGAAGRELVHVKNTGRCRELLVPGRRVSLALAANSNRKTRYDLVAVEKPGLGWVNIDSQAPNQVVREWLAGQEGISLLRPEYKYGRSRVDFYLEYAGRRALMEVKGCTLEVDGVGYFPDAPTARGVKHLQELAGAVGQGYDCFLAFVIAMPGVREVRPNLATHPEFGKALAMAREAGVRVLYLPCTVGPSELAISGCILAD